MAGMLSASHARARAANSATDSITVGVTAVRSSADSAFDCSIHAQVVFLRCAKHGAVQRNPTQIQMQIVLPGDADAAVHLHAGLHDLGRPSPPRRTWRCWPTAPPASGGDVGDRRGRGVVAAARFQPHLHVGEAVLEGLVGRQRSPEGVPVERPLHGEVEHRLSGCRPPRRTAESVRSGSAGR